MLKPHLPLTLLLTSLAMGAHAAFWAGTETHTNAVVDHQGEVVPAAEALTPSRELHIVLSLRPRNAAALDSRVALIQQGVTSALLSPTQFASLHAPTASQVQAVVDYLKARGFYNVTVAANQLLVSADGNGAAVEAAFNTELHNFTVDGRAVIANISDPQIPATLAGTVLAVHGLQNYAVLHTLNVRADGSTTKTASTTPVLTAHSPLDFAKIYGAGALATAVTVPVGIIAEGNLTQTLDDLATFTASNGLASVKTNVDYVGGDSGDTSGIDEWNLDSQTVVAASGGVSQLNFYVAQGMDNASILDAINAAVAANKAQVINVSLGECELDAKASGFEASTDVLFKAAIAQGQTFSVSTGDTSAFECGGRHAEQAYPAVSPYVVAVGGTSLRTVQGTSYGSEVVWYVNSAEGTGGGPSTTEAAPAWQTSSGVLGKATSRGVPDIAFDADPRSGTEVVINGSSNGNIIGGTSLAAPLFTGFWARIIANHSGTLAYPASAFYKYFPAQEKTVMHDVTSGSNGAYSAKAGWDYTSGFGSFNVGSLSSFVNANSGF